MATRRSNAPSQATHGRALRRRIRNLYQAFNLGEWGKCFHFIDPKLREQSRVELSKYANSLGEFKKRCGNVTIWHVRVNLYTDVHNNKHDDRPFAYAYVFWQDGAKAFHVFRERWVLDSGRWYTRVVGLVAQERANAGSA